MQKLIPHNHPILEPENNELYHPDSDPRVLQSSCPACKEIMASWYTLINRMIKDGV